MYVPASFQVDGPEAISGLIGRHPFGTLVTSVDGVPFASHLPLLMRQGADGRSRLVSHMARANPQWKHFATGTEVLAIFHGPQAYVSPAWYQVHPAVPTWNYAVVHVYGVPAIISEPAAIVEILHDMVETFESPLEHRWSGEIPVEYRDRLIEGIVAFEIAIGRIEGKFKLSQNRSGEDRQGVLDALSASRNPEDRAVAELMSAVQQAGGRP